jgi:hypothetical protein
MYPPATTREPADGLEGEHPVYKQALFGISERHASFDY